MAALECIRNLSNLGIQTSLCSVVGKDSAGDLLIDQLLEKDIQISNVFRLDSIRTTEKMRIVATGNKLQRDGIWMSSKLIL